jgi:hypothetical protein
MSKQLIAEEKDNISAKHRTEVFFKPIVLFSCFLFFDQGQTETKLVVYEVVEFVGFDVCMYIYTFGLQMCGVWD